MNSETRMIMVNELELLSAHLTLMKVSSPV